MDSLGAEEPPAGRDEAVVPEPVESALPEAAGWDEAVVPEPVESALPEAAGWDEAVVPEPAELPVSSDGADVPQAIRTMEIAIAPRIKGMVQPFTLKYRDFLDDIFPPAVLGAG
jgi:hypothetical protein